MTANPYLSEHSPFDFVPWNSLPIVTWLRRVRMIYPSLWTEPGKSYTSRYGRVKDCPNPPRTPRVRGAQNSGASV